LVVVDEGVVVAVVLDARSSRVHPTIATNATNATPPTSRRAAFVIVPSPVGRAR
jgi:hypothetical protein